MIPIRFILLLAAKSFGELRTSQWLIHIRLWGTAKDSLVLLIKGYNNLICNTARIKGPRAASSSLDAAAIQIRVS